MAELKKYLDQAGLQVLWDQAKAKFIDNAELTAALADYETIEDLERDYFNKTQIQEKIDALANVYATQTALAGEVTRATTAETTLQTNITAEATRATTAEAKKVDKEIQGTNGKAIIFNEADGGGAKFEHNDGTWSFAGVNDGGSTGMAGQIYAVDSNNGYKGAKLDIWEKGIFYTTGDDSLKSQAERAVAANEIATISDIAEYTMVKDSAPGEYASVYHLTKNGVNVGAAIQIAKDQLLKSVTVKTCTEAGVPLPELNVGDKYIDFEFETTSGTSHSYLAVKDMVTPYTAGDGIAISDANVISVSAIGIEKVTGLQTALDAKALATDLTAEITRATAAEATKTDKQISGSNGTAYIFNESDGGGAKFENTSGIESFIGVNDGGTTSDGLAAQIYADKYVGGKWQGAKLDVTNNGMYYTVGDKSFAERAVAANEIATVGKVNAKVDKPVEPVAGQGVNVPYYFSVAYAADKATVTDYTLDLLDNTKAPATYNLDIVGATASAAGLMVAADKDKLDNIDTLTQAEIEAICQ